MVELWRQGKMCDVEVTAGSRSVRAHSLVLASASVFFRTFFTSSVGPGKSSVDSGLSPTLLEPLLDFIYTGACSVDEALLVEVLEGAERLGVPALLDEVVKAIIQRLSVDSCVGAWSLALRFSIAALEQAAYKETRKCVIKLGASSLGALSAEQMRRLLEDDRLPVKEEEAFQALVRWHGAQSPPPSSDTMAPLVACIRFKLLPGAFVRDEVKTSQLMASRQLADVLIDALVENAPQPRTGRIPMGVRLIHLPVRRD